MKKWLSYLLLTIWSLSHFWWPTNLLLVTDLCNGPGSRQRDFTRCEANSLFVTLASWVGYSLIRRLDICVTNCEGKLKIRLCQHLAHNRSDNGSARCKLRDCLHLGLVSGSQGSTTGPEVLEDICFVSCKLEVGKKRNIYSLWKLMIFFRGIGEIDVLLSIKYGDSGFRQVRSAQHYY